jgi:hypothetical protein
MIRVTIGAQTNFNYQNCLYTCKSPSHSYKRKWRAWYRPGQQVTQVLCIFRLYSQHQPILTFGEEHRVLNSSANCFIRFDWLPMRPCSKVPSGVRVSCLQTGKSHQTAYMFGTLGAFRQNQSTPALLPSTCWLRGYLNTSRVTQPSTEEKYMYHYLCTRSPNRGAFPSRQSSEEWVCGSCAVHGDFLLTTYIYSS